LGYSGKLVYVHAIVMLFTDVVRLKVNSTIINGLGCQNVTNG